MKEKYLLLSLSPTQYKAFSFLQLFFKLKLKTRKNTRKFGKKEDLKETLDLSFWELPSSVALQEYLSEIWDVESQYNSPTKTRRQPPLYYRENGKIAAFSRQSVAKCHTLSRVASSCPSILEYILDLEFGLWILKYDDL